MVTQSGYLSSVPSFAEIVLAERTKRDMTQAEFARFVGVSGSTIYEAERGSTPDIKTVNKVASAIGMTPTDLMPPEAAYRRNRPRKLATGNNVRFSDIDRLLLAHVGDILSQGGDMAQGPDGDLFIELCGYWQSMAKKPERRRELVRVAYQLAQTSAVDPMPPGKKVKG